MAGDKIITEMSTLLKLLIVGQELTKQEAYKYDITTFVVARKMLEDNGVLLSKRRIPGNMMEYYMTPEQREFNKKFLN